MLLIMCRCYIHSMYMHVRVHLYTFDVRQPELQYTVKTMMPFVKTKKLYNMVPGRAVSRTIELHVVRTLTQRKTSQQVKAQSFANVLETNRHCTIARNFCLERLITELIVQKRSTHSLLNCCARWGHVPGNVGV